MVSLYKKEKKYERRKKFFFVRWELKKVYFWKGKMKKNSRKKLMEPIAKKNEKFIKRKICDIAKYWKISF